MTVFDDEMMKALEADGEYLRQMTGGDHGPYFLGVDHRTMNEELEAKLAECEARLEKAMEALGRIADDCEADYPPSHGAIKHDARTTLAEIKGSNT